MVPVPSGAPWDRGSNGLLLNANSVSVFPNDAGVASANGNDLFLGASFLADTDQAGNGTSQTDLLALASINSLNSFVASTIPGADTPAFRSRK